jgi:hypothetical protein
MTRSVLLLVVAAALSGPFQAALPQGTVVSDDKLPPASVELKRNEPPAAATPWKLPKPGDPLYDAKKEADIKKNKHSQWARAFERGVFKGYVTVTFSPPMEAVAKKMDSAFTPNAKLPLDAVQLSSSEQPARSDYFPTRPKTRPANVPPDFIVVRVFHRGKFIGWSYLPKEGVAALHKPQ